METKEFLESVQTLQAMNLLCGKESEWLTFVKTISSVIIGSFIGFLSSYLLQKQKDKREEKSLSSAMIAEIDAILRVIEKRGYIEGLEQEVAALENGDIEDSEYSVIIPGHYSRLYQSNASRIGLINNKLSSRIITFHQLIDSVVQDISPNGTISKNKVSADDLRETIKFLKDAVKLGNEINANYV